MIDYQLDQLKLYKMLQDRSRKEKIASIFVGALVGIAGDARELLEYVRRSFPLRTAHNLQHSWRALSRIENILTPKALDVLSSVEIFCLITAAAFHDIGMIDAEAKSEEHHVRSEEILRDYFCKKLTLISEQVPRLSECIGFIIRCHGMPWDEMVASELFKRTERILEQQLRMRVLAVLLRIGDLLDIDSDRSSDAVRLYAIPDSIDTTSLVHHERHKHVTHFNYNQQTIEITVEAHSKEEHIIWADWLGWLEQEILHANTFVFRDNLEHFYLPVPQLKIKKAPGATYDIWPIRFEIDEKGKIWDVISKSIYTQKFDFVRELIQNAIDATLSWIYAHDDATVEGQIPRLWSLKGYYPSVVVLYSEKRNTLVLCQDCLCK